MEANQPKIYITNQEIKQILEKYTDEDIRQAIIKTIPKFRRNENGDYTGSREYLLKWGDLDKIKNELGIKDSNSGGRKRKKTLGKRKTNKSKSRKNKNKSRKLR